MDKQAENTFIGGLNTDRHPLTSQANELTNARNIDLIAIGEGYQLILQKREGNQELFFLPSAWNALSKYLTNEYVTELNTTYKSLVDNNIGIDPATHPNSWQPQATVLVPAGLRPGFIPLAVKEFNEVAYIISVQPSSGVGEIGTFPSPDYTQFIYVEGSLLVGAAEVDPDHSHWKWDPRSNPPDYEFVIGPFASSGTDEVVQSETDVFMSVPLVDAGFTISNTGILPDSYTLTRNIPNANVITKVDGSVYTYGTLIYIYPGSHRTITFEIQHPFVAIYDIACTYNNLQYVTDGTNLYQSIQVANVGNALANPTYWTPMGLSADYAVNTLVDTIITITSTALPLVPQTYNFKYHLAPEIAIRYQSDLPITYVFGSIGFGDLTHIIPYNSSPSGELLFKWITNDASILASFSAYSFTPATVGNAVYNVGYQVDVHFEPNPIVTPCKVNSLSLIGTFSASGSEPSGTTTVNIYAEQYPHP